MERHRVVLLCAMLSTLLVGAPFLFGDSNIRFVRLSFVQGSVLIDRGSGQGFERAIMNMPVNSSTRLRTGDTGLAEVEFEDGSTLRLIGNTSVLLQPLSLSSTGQRLSGITISEGTVYLHVQKSKQDVFYVNNLGLELNKSARLRISVDSDQTVVAVFNGNFLDPRTGVSIGKKESFRIDNKSGAITAVAKGIDPFITDPWNAEREKYLKNPGKYPKLATTSIAFAPSIGIDSCNYGMMSGFFGMWGNNCCYYGYEPYPMYYWVPTTNSPASPPPPPAKGPVLRPPRPHMHPNEIVSFPKTAVKVSPIIAGRTVLPAESRTGRPMVANDSSAVFSAATTAPSRANANVADRPSRTVAGSGAVHSRPVQPAGTRTWSERGGSSAASYRSSGGQAISGSSSRSYTVPTPVEHGRASGSTSSPTTAAPSSGSSMRTSAPPPPPPSVSTTPSRPPR